MSKSILIFACIFAMCVKPPEHVAVSDKSVEIYADSIKNESLKILSIGGFYDRQKVEQLYLDLEYKGILSDEIAAKKITVYIQGMLVHINNDATLAKFLIKETFLDSDISISLAYMSEGGKPSQVHLSNGKIVFSTYNTKTNQLVRNYSIPLALE